MIEIDDVRFGYGREPLFRGLSLRMERGNIYGLLGRNGAGKTSLLRILSGQLFPHAGACSVLGEKPKDRSPSFLSEIFFLPEEFYAPPVYPEQYVRMYGTFYPRFDRNKFDSYIREFDLSTSKRLSAYSYGQRKKMLLAFGLATGCSLLLLDEPTNGLDIPSKSQFRRLTAQAIGDDQTFVISTHQVRDMEHLIDPIIILEDGKIIFNESLQTVNDRLAVRLSQEREPGRATAEGRTPEGAPAQRPAAQGPTPKGAVLYSEKVLGGYTVVTERTDTNESSPDIELLFNAIVGGGESIQAVFEKGGTT